MCYTVFHCFGIIFVLYLDQHKNGVTHNFKVQCSERSCDDIFIRDCSNY